VSKLFKWVVMPLYLFSGTFFPVSQLPPVLRVLAYVGESEASRIGERRSLVVKAALELLRRTLSYLAITVRALASRRTERRLRLQ
jgi:lipooligosaccharide transport system permease protein